MKYATKEIKEQIQLTRMGLAMLGKEYRDETIDRFIMVYDLIKDKGDKATLKDFAEIENAIDKIYNGTY